MPDPIDGGTNDTKIVASPTTENQFADISSQTDGTFDKETKDAKFSEEEVADSVFDGEAFKSEKEKTALKEKATLTKLEQEQQDREIIQKEVEAKASKDKAAATTKDAKKEEAKETSKEEEETEELDDQGKPKDKRDYTGLSKEDTEYLKKLPNHIFKVAAPIAKERYKLQQEVTGLKDTIEKNKDPNRIPENWYEHERAIELTPQYQQLSNKYERYHIEGNHWQQQIIRINQGLPWKDLNYTKERGYFPSEEKAVPETPEGKAALLGQLENAKTQAFTESAALQSEAKELSKKFRSEHDGINSHYDKAIEEFLSPLPEELKPKKEHEQQFYDFVHPAHKSSSLTKVAAGLFSLCLNQGNVIKGLLADKGKEKKIIEDKKAAGPSNRSSLTSNGRNGINGAGRRPIIGEDGKVTKDSVIDFSELDKEFNGE